MPTKKKKPASKPATSGTVDPARAKAAYEELKESLDAIPKDKLVAVRVDTQLAGAHAFGVAERDRAQERAAEFAKLVTGKVIAANPSDRLAQAALAAWYARQQQQRFATQGQGLVAAAIADAAEALKKRMLKVVAHAFGDHPTHGPEIEAIRAGTGYQDTANDLQQLADMYEVHEVAEVIEDDRLHFRKTDADEARALAGKIFKALGYEDSDAAEWGRRVQRAYTHLEAVYTAHCYGGALLFHESEDVATTYPMSLISVVRAPRGRTEVVTDAVTPPIAPPVTGEPTC